MTRSPDAGRTGLPPALLAQAIWGVQPLFWPLLGSENLAQVIAQRVLWSCAWSFLFVTATRSGRTALRVLVNGRALRSFALSGALLGVSWTLYLVAVISGHVVETSLALSIAPLLGAMVGVVVLGERLRAVQWAACGLAGVAVGILVVGYGRVPVLALGLSTALAVYSLVVKRRASPALPTTALELFAMVPVAVVVGTWTTAADGVPSGTAALLLFPAAGLITALPTLLRAEALNRLPLSVFSIIMYVNPVIQFAIGVWVRHEPMSPLRWTGFLLTWCALLLFVADTVKPRTTARKTGPPESRRARSRFAAGVRPTP